MNNKTLTTIKIIAVAVFLILALGWAGQSDYEDAVVTEMKNNGSYWKLSEQYPQASDTELIAIYKRINNK